MQVDEHPSLSMVFPSSHYSLSRMSPSPQTVEQTLSFVKESIILGKTYPSQRQVNGHCKQIPPDVSPQLSDALQTEQVYKV